MSRDGYVFLNGRFAAASRASVSVYDRGLLYGDGLFETMRAYRGKVFALEEHLDRLARSARVLGLPVPAYDWRATIAELLRRNALHRRDAWVRVTLTRGAADPDILPPVPPRPTAIVMVKPVDPKLAAKQRRGVAVALLPYSRHGFIPEHKSLNYLPAVVGKVLAARHGAHEGLFVRNEHFLTEGTTSSLFVVQGKSLWTTPIGGILPGVTRRRVLELAERAQFRTLERELTTTDLLEADEAFLTSSVAEIVPIIEVDQTRIGDGTPGPLTRKLQRLYRAEVERDRKKNSGGKRQETETSRRRAVGRGGAPDSRP
jgi:branched-chain amino acid aminotransferase